MPYSADPPNVTGLIFNGLFRNGLYKAYNSDHYGICMTAFDPNTKQTIVFLVNAYAGHSLNREYYDALVEKLKERYRKY